MKSIYKPGDQKRYVRVVQQDDVAAFHGEVVHPVCATFAMARDFEWTSRLFFLDMKEPDEEGVGTLVTVHHVAPAKVGQEIEYLATVERLSGMELFCKIEASIGGKRVAFGETGQRMLKKERLKQLFE